MKSLINTCIHNPLKSFAIVSIFLFGITLTHWQIQRGFLKLNELTHSPVELQDSKTIETANHLDKLTLTGQFLPQYIFVQPRTNKNHQPGFQVWVPFSSNGRHILVSLGFQEAIKIPTTTNIHGTIHIVSSPPFRLENNSILGQSPYTVGQLDLPLFRNLIHIDLERYVLVLDHADDLSLATNTIDDVLKHFNYSAQFFIITSVICYYMIRKIDWT